MPKCSADGLGFAAALWAKQELESQFLKKSFILLLKGFFPEEHIARVICNQKIGILTNFQVPHQSMTSNVKFCSNVIPIPGLKLGSRR